MTRHVLWQKIKVQDPQGPASSIHFRILGSQGPASNIHFRILGSRGPMSSIHFRILGFQGPTSSIHFRIQGSQGPTSGTQFRILGSQGLMTSINFRIQNPQGLTSYRVPKIPQVHISESGISKIPWQVGMHCRIQCSQGPMSSWLTSYNFPPSTYHPKPTTYNL